MPLGSMRGFVSVKWGSGAQPKDSLETHIGSLIMAVAHLTPQQLAEIKDAFSLFDEDGSGTITTKEIGSVMQSLGQTASEAEIEEMVKEFDEDGNGEIDFNEFLEMMASRVMQAGSEDVTLEIFGVFDEDQKGYITQADVLRVMKRLGEPAQEAQDLFAAADVNGDGSIDYGEFAPQEVEVDSQGGRVPLKRPTMIPRVRNVFMLCLILFACLFLLEVVPSHFRQEESKVVLMFETPVTPKIITEDLQDDVTVGRQLDWINPYDKHFSPRKGEEDLALVGNPDAVGAAAQLIKGKKLNIGWLAPRTGYNQRTNEDCIVQCVLSYNNTGEGVKNLDAIFNPLEVNRQSVKPDQVWIAFSLEADGTWWDNHWTTTRYDEVGHRFDIVSNFHFSSDEKIRSLRRERRKFLHHTWNYLIYASWESFIKMDAPEDSYSEVMMSAMISNARDTSKRASYLSQLMSEGISTHSFGQVLNNANESMYPDCESAGSWYWPRKVCIMRKYKFHFAAENTFQESYVTEKFWLTLEVGVVPIVFGAPNAHLFCPNEYPCAIFAKDYKTPRHLADYMKKVYNDEKLYKSYLEWRKHPPSRQFLSIMRAGHQQSTLCSLCQQVAVLQAFRRKELTEERVFSITQMLIADRLLIVSTVSDLRGHADASHDARPSALLRVRIVDLTAFRLEDTSRQDEMSFFSDISTSMLQFMAMEADPIQPIEPNIKSTDRFFNHMMLSGGSPLLRVKVTTPIIKDEQRQDIVQPIDRSILKKADTLLAQKKVEDAKMLLENASQHTNDPELSWRLSKTYFDLSETKPEDNQWRQQWLQKGREVASSALEEHPEHQALHKWMAFNTSGLTPLQPRDEKIKSAFDVKKHAEEAARLNPLDADVHYLLGRWKYNVASVGWMERMAAKLPQTDYREALQDLQKAERLNGSMLRNNIFLGDTFLALSDRGEAKRCYEKALSLPTSNEMDKKMRQEVETKLKSL
ncbi:hypothetical protein PROFUN_08248 [Planoprotostelium fungivorum]|uniref:Fucosyltransferase n=1 Tax=Planoprotostelium fungivorum TaxID=1890364 RepID=A0A2P6NK97_9EUKA|nr:hypothetical protein PROFUN_08248 [Planoprotostelium fungivorum]